MHPILWWEDEKEKKNNAAEEKKGFLMPHMNYEMIYYKSRDFTSHITELSKIIEM